MYRAKPKKPPPHPTDRASFTWKPPSLLQPPNIASLDDESALVDFHEKWIKELDILYPNISTRDLKTLAFGKSRDFVENGKTVLNITPAYLLLSMKFRNMSPGLACQQFVVEIRNKGPHSGIDYEQNHLDDFRNYSIGRIRIITMLDDFLFQKDCGYFLKNTCIFCKKKWSHLTWVCPLYPTEDYRHPIMVLENRCDGCGVEGCNLGYRVHEKENMPSICRTCHEKEGENGVKYIVNPTHVGWRCASMSCNPQMRDQINRYYCFMMATRCWKDEDFQQLLTDVCETFVVPYPAGIFDAN